MEINAQIIRELFNGRSGCNYVSTANLSELYSLNTWLSSFLKAEVLRKGLLPKHFK